MPVYQHSRLPIREVPRIKTRVLVDAESGSTKTAVWEQWIHPGGYIPPHYHDTEEVLIILAGSAQFSLGDEKSLVRAPSTVLIPAGQVHGLSTNGDEDVHLVAFFPVAQPRILAPDGSIRPMPWEDVDS